MNLRAILRAADPLRHEPPHPDQERERLRQTILSAVPVTSSLTWCPIRLSVVVPIGVFLVGLALIGAQAWLHDGSMLQAQVRFEVRLAEDRPAPGLTEARIRDSDRVIYLHEEIITTNDDVARAAVVQGDTAVQYSVDLRFTDTGAQRMREATARHIGKPMAVLIDGAVVIAPVVRVAIGAAAMITGDYTRAEAERIVAGIGNR